MFVTDHMAEGSGKSHGIVTRIVEMLQEMNRKGSRNSLQVHLITDKGKMYSRLSKENE